MALRFSPRALLITLALAAGVVHFLAAINKTADFCDGALFNVSTMDTARAGTMYINDRLTPAIILSPAVMALRFFGFARAHHFAQEYFYYSYALLPWLLLLASLFILLRSKREDLLPYPILSFSLATLSTLHFSTSTVPETLGIFWILIAAQASNKDFTRARTAAVAALSLLLGLGYESGLALFPILIYFCFQKKQPLWACSAGLIPLAIRFLRLNSTGRFTADFLNYLHSPYFVFVVITFQLLAVLLLMRKMKALSAYTWVPVLMQLDNFIYWLNMMPRFPLDQNEMLMWHAHDARSLAVPVAATVGLFLLWAQTEEMRSAPDITKPLALIAALSLMAGVTFYLGATLSWKPAMDKFSGLIQKLGPGCHSVSDAQLTALGGLGTLFAPYQSLLVQDPLNIKTVIFSDNPFFQQFYGTAPCLPFSAANNQPKGIVELRSFKFTEAYSRQENGQVR